jgi:mercuric ion transport protein
MDMAEKHGNKKLDIEILYFQGCPNHAPTVDKVREALQSEGQSAEIQEVEVRTQAEAEAMGFLGSPSVHINDLDIEPEARKLKTYGLSCRTYLNGATRSGIPSADLIRRALKEHIEPSQTITTNNNGACCHPIEESSARPDSSAFQQQPPSGAIFAGGLAAILASTCCLGPLLLVSIGISGAWIANLTRLEPYRPYFIAIALVALFFAGKRIYRPAQLCRPGEICALPKTRRLYKFLFWTSCAFTVLALTFPYFLKYFY